MTELQQTEFCLLREFDRVCKELGLAYFLVCGSALGAVKYQGFIPWDDDIDVAMCRKDYEVFLARAPGLLAEGLFLQNHRSEPNFPQIYSKLRNSNTTYIERSAADIDMNHGIFIDIFPLDGYPRNRMAQRILEFRKRLYNSMLLSAFDVPGGALRKLWRFLGISGQTRYVAAAYDRMIRRYPAADSEVLCNHGNWQGVLDYASASEFGVGRPMRFEGLEVLVPEQYDAYLRRKYGDYQAELPPQEQVGHHYYDVCDCHVPYKNFKTGVATSE